MLASSTSLQWWLRITYAFINAAGNPDTDTLLEGPIQFIDGPVISASVPPAAGFRIWLVGGQYVPQILCDDGHYHTILGQTVAGVLTLTLSDAAY